MPANLTPEYEKAELRYRQAATDAERLTALQEMLSTIPKHKGTEKMQADIKRRMSHLRREEQRASHSKGPDPFHVPKTGAGQVVLAGPPNTGKSSLLAATTNADAKVAEYPFSTAVPQPGMWNKDDIQIELVDTPPFTAEHIPSGLLGTIRNADAVCVVVDGTADMLDQLEMVLEVLRARGLELTSVPKASLPIEAGKKPGLVAVNKCDSAPSGSVHGLEELIAETSAPLEVIAVSAKMKHGLDELFARLWRLLSMIRVYSKEPGKSADLHKPFVVPLGATVADLARQIHRDLPETMKFARLWGHSRFEGQHVHKTEVLQDHDVVEIHE